MKKPLIHLICNAHLDPVWQWQWEEGCAEAISTFRNAVQLLREHPHLIFNHNESVLYHWIQIYDPPLFSEIQGLVKKGRWSISGGWYLQPDANLISTESIIRHICEGRRFFHEHFQVIPKVAYNFDSFGHSGGLPQILAKSGYKMYIHMRPQAADLDLPSDIYRWMGVDGSEIIGLRSAVGLYHTEYDNIEQRIKEGVVLALKLQRDVPVFWGIGDHGGGATREDLNKIDFCIQNEDRVKIIHSTPDIFYEAIKGTIKTAPVVEGGLQRVFTGCYTSLSRLKRRSQESLYNLLQTEALSTMTWWTLDQDYPVDKLTEAWRDHLFNDFHDILPGTCIEPAEQDALDQYGKVSETVRRIRLGAVMVINRDSKQRGTIPVAILNTNPSITRMPVEIECMISHRPKWKGTWHLKLLSTDGQKIVCQEEQPEALLPFNGWRRKVVFLSDLPSLGVATYYLEPVKGEKMSHASGSNLHIHMDPEMGLVDILGDETGQQWLTGHLLRPLVIEDAGDSWGTDRKAYRNIIGQFEASPVGITTLVDGPVRTVYESILTYNHSKIIIQTLSYAHWPVLEYRLRILWHEERKRLKLEIPTVFDSDSLLCEIPGGVIFRPADGDEHVHGRWFLLSKDIDGQKKGLGVVHNGLHGLDYKSGTVRFSVLRSAAYCHEQGFQLTHSPAPKYMDQGVHTLRLLLYPGQRETVLKSLPGLADWICAPPVVYAHLPIGAMGDADNLHVKDMGDKRCTDFIKIDPNHVRLIACKRSWDGKALIIRLQESCGFACRAKILLNHPPLEIQIPMKSLEIKTMRIEQSGEWKEVDMIEEM